MDVRNSLTVFPFNFLRQGLSVTLFLELTILPGSTFQVLELKMFASLLGLFFCFVLCGFFFLFVCWWNGPLCYRWIKWVGFRSYSLTAAWTWKWTKQHPKEGSVLILRPYQSFWGPGLLIPCIKHFLRTLCCLTVYEVLCILKMFTFFWPEMTENHKWYNSFF